jgi:hypothetical protein
MELVQTSLLEEMEKTKALEVDELQWELACNLNPVNVERP